MDNIRHKKTLVSELEIGMFVSELDRPWLGTPFLLEGVLIENETQIEQIKSLCQFVYIDHTFSVGIHYIHPERHSNKRNIEGLATTQHQISPAEQPTNNLDKTDKPLQGYSGFSFFDVLKEIKASNKTAIRLDNQNTDTPANVQVHSSFKKIDNTPIYEDTLRQPPSLAAQIKADLSSFVSGLRYWKQKQTKSALKSSAVSNESDRQVPLEQPSGFSNTIIDERIPVEKEIATIYPVYEQSQTATQAIFEALAKNQKIDLSKVDNALNHMVESIERNPDALIWLAKLKQTDNYSYNHALNVSITLMAFANFLALSRKQIKDLGLAGLLQDVGKVKISAQLLQKKEKITDEELELLKRHVNYALELLGEESHISANTMLTIAQHHERLDGTGYPAQLKGKQISLAGQLAGLIDTYCALTSNKPYSKGVYNQIALDKLQELRDTKFYGVLIDQLIQFMGMYPVGTLVELNSGEIGVVIQQNSVRRLLPRVMLLLNPDKTKNNYPPTINLINSPISPSGEPYKIVKALPPNSYGLSINNYFE